MKRFRFFLLTVLLITLSALCASAYGSDYYAAPDGTGDGRTKDTPASAIATIIQSVNNDGWGAGDTVTVHVSGAENKTTWFSSAEDGDFVKFNATGLHHAATIIYTSEDALHPAKMVYSTYENQYQNWFISGPSVFHDITMVDQRKDTAESLYTLGYSVTLGENVTHLRLLNNGTLTEKNLDVFSHTNRSTGTPSNTSGSITIANTGKSLGYVVLGGYGDNASQKCFSIPGVDYTINGGKVNKLVLNDSSIAPTVNGDVSFTFNNVMIGGVSTSHNVLPVINGSFEVLLNGSSSLPDTTLFSQLSCPVFILDASDNVNGTLEKTDKPGVYVVQSDLTAFAVSSDGETVYYSEKDTLSVPADSYRVFFTENFEDLTLKTPLKDGYSFIRWENDIDVHCYRAMFDKYVPREPLNGNFYLMYGGTGNGLSASQPAGSLASIVEYINGIGYIAGDVATVYVMDAPDAFTYLPSDFGSRNVPHHLTSWTTPSAHTATLSITGYKGTDSHLATGPYFGGTEMMDLGGPTIFDNITFVMARVYDASLQTNGHDCTVTGSVQFYRFKSDLGNTSLVPGTGSWLGTLVECPAIIKTGRNSSAKQPMGNGGVLDLTIAGGQSFDFRLGGYREVHTYTDDFTANINTFGAPVSMSVGSTSGFQPVFDKNVNLVFGDTGAITSKISDKVPLTVNGALQILHVSEINEYTDQFNVKNGIYDLILPEAGTLSVTEKAGTFLVKEGKIVCAEKENGARFYGSSKLVLSPGVYSVTYVESIPGTSEKEADAEYYVKYGGTGDGRSETAPAGSIKNAVNAINADGWGAGDAVTVYVMDADDVMTYCPVIAGRGVTASHFTAWSYPAHYDCTITFRGYYGTSSHLATAPNFGDTSQMMLNGPTVFDDITLVAMRMYDASLESLGYDCTITDTCVFKRLPNDFGSAGLVWDGTLSDYSFLIKHGRQAPGSQTIGTGGTMRLSISNNHSLILRVPGYRENGTFTDDVNIYVDHAPAGVIVECQSINPSTYAKNLNMVFGDTGSISFSKSGTIPTSVLGDIQIIHTADMGDFTPYFDLSGDIWDITTSKINLLELTEVSGKFKVCTDTAVLASDDAGNLYPPKDGYLTLPAGIYHVIDSSDEKYIDFGDRLVMLADSTIKFSEKTMIPQDGKIFLGWVAYDEKGNIIPLSDDTPLTAGTVAYAKYLDYDMYKNDLFNLIGVQMRTEGLQALRFVIEKKNDLALPNVSEFGAVVLPAEYVLGKEMTLDTTHDGYRPSRVPAKNIFAETDDGLLYTVCLTGIDETHYERAYTVRGYIQWTDYNGNPHCLYTNYYLADLYQVARAALDDPDGQYSDTVRDNLQLICDRVEITDRKAYFESVYGNESDSPEKASRITLLSGYPTTADKDPNHAMYRLANGLKIREVEIDSGKGGDDTIEIVQFADIHFNYANSRDMEEANPALMSTLIYRTWNKNGGSAPWGLKLVEYANKYDKCVVTGDIMDFLAWGSRDMMEQILVKRLYNGSYACGNHEPRRQMEGLVPDTATEAEIYTLLEKLWPHDLYYTSEILSDDDGIEKVMIVVMDNNRDRYWDRQIEPFARDIAIAREKEIPILIFQHDPICTRNPAEKAAVFFYEGSYSDEMPIDMTTHFAGNAGSYTGATKEMYDLIVNNGDVIRGLFCGHWHQHMYTEVIAKTASGEDTVIPQYIVSTANSGNAIKITVK